MTQSSTHAPWTASVLTLFPDVFSPIMHCSILGRALKRNLWRFQAYQLRSFAFDRHATVDGPPYGGGPGMVLRADVIDAALQHICKLPSFPKETVEVSQQNQKPFIVVPSPRGHQFSQKMATQWLAQHSHVIFVCGHYEGIDQRVLDAWQVHEVSLGDFILSGGEIAAMAFIDACVRLIPHVLGAAESLEYESFSGDQSFLLEYPHFTRPALWKNKKVPDILLSGHHAHIEKWRHEKSKEITCQRRPDLWHMYQNSRKGDAPYE